MAVARYKMQDTLHNISYFSFFRLKDFLAAFIPKESKQAGHNAIHS